MALISFFADDLSLNLNGSGLGFYGASFGQSVEVGTWQTTTSITDGTGQYPGGLVENTKYTHPFSGINSTIGPTTQLLRDIPNRLATLNIRFTHDSAVRVQNTKLRIFDRSNINNPASGVTTKVAQIIHPYSTVGATGSGDLQWSTPAGSALPMTLVGSPGVSGWHLTQPTWTDIQHDFFVVISASPNSIGAKTLYGLYVETEYL